MTSVYSKISESFDSHASKVGNLSHHPPVLSCFKHAYPMRDACACSCSPKTPSLHMQCNAFIYMRNSVMCFSHQFNDTRRNAKSAA